MPGVGSFEIESYTVTVLPRRIITTRSLLLQSVAESHGIRHRATISFEPDDQIRAEFGTAYNVGGLNFNGVTVYAYAPTSSFEPSYHVLQTEKPVYFKYFHLDSPDTTKQLYWFSIGTDAEFLGEGHSDPNAVSIIARAEIPEVAGRA
jgi:hypothetical protein